MNWSGGAGLGPRHYRVALANDAGTFGSGLVTVFATQRRDGRAVHVRKATRPQPRHQTLNTILKLDPNPGGTHRTLF